MFVRFTTACLFAIGEWLEMVRFSKTAEASQIYQQVDDLIDFALKAGFIS